MKIYSDITTHLTSNKDYYKDILKEKLFRPFIEKAGEGLNALKKKSFTIEVDKVLNAN